MPLHIAEKVERAGRYTLFFADGLVVVLLLVLMSRNSVPAALVGLRLEPWKIPLLVGVGAGLCWVGLQRAILLLVPAARPPSAGHYIQEGSALLWVLIFVAGAFAEEFWRAFCLFALRNSSHSISFSVMVTAIAFGAAHARLRFEALAKVVFGIAAALVFVWLGSLIPTYLFHLIGNLGSLYWFRRAGVS